MEGHLSLHEVLDCDSTRWTKQLQRRVPDYGRSLSQQCPMQYPLVLGERRLNQLDSYANVPKSAWHDHNGEAHGLWFQWPVT